MSRNPYARSSRRFPPRILRALRESKILGIRAGRAPHRFIAIWVVVVEDRVFIRSWYVKARSWYRTFLEDPHGVIQIAGRELAVRAVPTGSARLRDAVDQAYGDKYNTPGALKWVQGFKRAKSKATTLELVPAVRRSSAKRI